MIQADFKLNREAYKHARAVVRNAMKEKRLDGPAIVSVATKALEAYPSARIDMRDLVGACLFYQGQLYGSKPTKNEDR